MVVLEERPRIRTERLVLRTPELKDARRLGELANDWDVVRMTTRMPWPYPPEEARSFIQRLRRGGSDRQHTFLIEAPGEGPAGLMGFFYDEGQRLPEVGYWLGRPYWGQGFATEALDAAMRWAREGWGRRAIRSGHFADNHASGRVLTKAGFLYTGEVEQRFSRARGEPVATRMMIWLA
jgi:RimJ/RimL family protein N-acetyltransferase